MLLRDEGLWAITSWSYRFQKQQLLRSKDSARLVTIGSEQAGKIKNVQSISAFEDKEIALNSSSISNKVAYSIRAILLTPRSSPIYITSLAVFDHVFPCWSFRQQTKTLIVFSSFGHLIAVSFVVSCVTYCCCLPVTQATANGETCPRYPHNVIQFLPFYIPPTSINQFHNQENLLAHTNSTLQSNRQTHQQTIHHVYPRPRPAFNLPAR